MQKAALFEVEWQPAPPMLFDQQTTGQPKTAKKTARQTSRQAKGEKETAGHWTQLRLILHVLTAVHYVAVGA